MSLPEPALPPPPALESTRDFSLFLDFDGTLVDIAERHDAVRVAAGMPGLIAMLAREMDGRIAVVSGRPADEILTYLHPGGSALPFAAPPFAIAGSHGLEMRWTDGRREAPSRPPLLDEAVADFHRLATGHPGVVVEEKPLGAALHYRLAPDAGPACARLAESVARRAGFAIQHGKMVVELRSPGGDKGDAVRRFMGEAPMAGSRPVFLGDDLTDEAGFAAAGALGGWGILVGGPRATAARYRLAGVGAVRLWLEALARKRGPGNEQGVNG